jgi:hypothetical protein
VSAAASVLLCFEKWRLLGEYARAVSEYNRMNSAQVSALMNDKGFLFQKEIAAAAERRDAAKYAILEHQEAHGC